MHYFDLPIFMISFDSHWPIRFCSSGHTKQIPPSQINSLSHWMLSSMQHCCCWSLPMVQSTFFFPFSHCLLSLSLNWFSLSLPFYHLITALILSYFPFFSFSIWYVLGPKGFFFFFSPSNFSRSPPPKSDQISAVGLQGVVKKVLPLAGGIGR